MAFFTLETTPDDRKMTWQRYYTADTETNQVFCLVEESWTAFAFVVISLFEWKGPDEDDLGILVEFQRRQGCRTLAHRFQRRVHAHVAKCVNGRVRDTRLPPAENVDVVDLARAHIEELLVMSKSHFLEHQREGVTGLASIACNDACACFAVMCGEEYRAAVLDVCKVTLQCSVDMQAQRAAIGLLLNLSAQDTMFMHVLRAELNTCNFLQVYLHELCKLRDGARTELTTHCLARGVQSIFDLVHM